MRVSLTMIVRNEEASLPACLGGAADLVDEIVIVDTGSTDRTREIAARFGARVIDFAWIDDFAAARNAGLDQATGEWIWWLDADDRLDDANRAKLRQLFAQLPDDNSAYLMKVLSASGPVGGSRMVFDQIRLFRNHPAIRWQNRIHEVVRPSIVRLGGRIHPTDIVIEHTGYEDAATHQRKLQRNLDLLLRQLADQPDDPHTLFLIGRSYAGMDRGEEALPWLERALARAAAGANYLPKLYGLLAGCLERLGRLRQAWAVCAEGRRRFPADPELQYEEGILCMQLGDYGRAEADFVGLLRGLPPGENSVGVDVGIFGYKTRFNLGLVYLAQNRLIEAEQQWRAAVAERPDFLAAWDALGDVWLALGRFADVEQFLARLDADPARRLDAAVLRARMLGTCGHFVAARQVLQGIISQAPTHLPARVALAQVLLQENRDRPAIIAALQAVLALEPNHFQARQCLARYLPREGPPA
ncbi:MAG: glycosyltransferase [Gemmataceae bacterium]|nr:glycosyltransferase [Gemmataceae bacterium]MDW8265431.1 glycosyltransferase [Gemmataceae bacterium]